MTPKPSFTDTQDREWTLELNAGHVLRLHDTYGIDVGRAADQNDSFLAELVNGDNIITLLPMLAMMTERERADRNVSTDKFYEALGGDVLVDATSAFLQAIVNFTPPHKRAPLQAALTRVRQGTEMASTKVTQIINSPETEERINQIVDKAASQAFTG